MCIVKKLILFESSMIFRQRQCVKSLLDQLLTLKPNLMFYFPCISGLGITTIGLSPTLNDYRFLFMLLNLTKPLIQKVINSWIYGGCVVLLVN